MTFVFILAIAFTIGISALCSLLEAMILSTTTAEIEGLKKLCPSRGEKLEKYKHTQAIYIIKVLLIFLENQVVLILVKLMALETLYL